MMGKNHLITGFASTTAVVTWAVTLGAMENYTVNNVDGFIGLVAQGLGIDTAHAIQKFGVAVSNWILPYGPPITSQAGLYLLFGYTLMLLGNVLPDMDVPTSWAGQRFPGTVWRLMTRKNTPHRGITHSVWPGLLFLLCAIPVETRWMIFLFFGWRTHCFMDSFSKVGRAIFYPFGKHRVITFPDGNRCVVVPNHSGMYKTGKRSETVFTVLVVSWYVIVMSLLFFL